MKIAFVFPGQGAQYAGMGREIAEKFPTASAVFDEAERRGVEMKVVPTEKAIELLRGDPRNTNAVLHITC